MDNIVLATHYEDCWRHMGHHACATAKVEQLQSEVRELRACDATVALLLHQVRATCEQAGLGEDHALHDYVPLLGNKIAILTREVKRLRGDIHDEQVRRDEWEKMYDQAIAGTEVEQLRERLEHWKHISLKVAQMERSKQLVEVERLLKTALDNEVDSRVSVELEVERLQTELARLASDDPGHTYCAFCGAEYPQGTPRHGDGALTEHIMVCPEHPMREVEQERDKAETQIASIRESVEWLWGFWDGNTLIAKPGYEDDIHEAWVKLLRASDPSDAAVGLMERLAALDAAESTLASCGLTGIYDEFSSPANAIEQMVERLVQLEGGQALQNERQLRQEAEKRAGHLLGGRAWQEVPLQLTDVSR